MSVENPENTTNNENEIKPQNGEQDQRFNGLSNGHIENSSSSSHHKHKSSSKDKHRDKDREHKSSKSHSSSGRDKDSEKHKSSSSSDKDKHRDRDKERSDKDKDRDKHRDKEKEKDRDKDKEKDKHHHKDRDKDRDKHKSSSSSSHHHKSSNRDKEKSDKEKNDKERDKERSKDKDREHGKNKERDKEREKDKEKDRDKEKHRDKDKERSKDKATTSESNDREKDRKKDHKSSSHTKDRDRERSDKDKEKDKDRHHKSSSSSKDKHSSSTFSKPRDKDKDKHSSSSKDKDRHRDRDKDKKEKIETSSENKNLIVDSKANIKSEIEAPRNDYDQSCSGFPIKEENNIKPHFETKMIPQVNHEMSMNFSQASSCDYSMSQFRDDEPAFVIKEEMPSEDPLDVDYTQENDESGVKSEPEYDGEDDNDADYKEEDDDEDIPLAKRKRQKDESEDDIPLGNRKKVKTEKKKDKVKEKKAKKKKREETEEEDYLDDKPKKKKVKKEKVEPVAPTNTTTGTQKSSPTKGRKKKDEEPEDVWRWWEEEKRDDGVKWTFLEHKGPVFAPPYEPLPDNVRFFYDGKPMKLSNDAEEIASFYAKMLTHDYVTKKQFNDNFFKDWRKSMTSKEREIIKDLSKCNFKEMNEYFTALSEKRKQMSKEEKQKIKEENERLVKEYGFCLIDGHKQRIGNFKLEPPGLFRGRGEHPKMGLVKKRLMPEDVLINCSKDSKIPVPPKGHKWKEVRHDNTVTWLASWTENIQGQVKYIMLNSSSKLKGEKDYQKYETARRLDKHIDKIRATYRDEWKSKEMRIRQRGVALYFIDKLALRAGNEKDEDQADTVGCCSLRVEHIKLHKELNGKENVVEFDFLGKDSIRYYNQIEVEKRVFKNLELFMENKKEGDDLFDRLNTQVLNEHLRELMEGLTAKVFRTYNASITLQQQLDLLTDPDASVAEKLLAYNRANRAVAILCNHQRSIPKSHEKSMENLKEKIRQRREQLEDAENELRDLQKLAKRGSAKEKINADKKKKQVDRLREQLKKLELQQTDRDENKTIALSTSKLNYLDPRISVAWCKKHGVPVEKIFNKTQREKFRWAIDMADENYRF